MKTSKRRNRWALGLVPVLISGFMAATVSPASADPWVNGDVLAAVSDGQYQSFTIGGSLEHTINAGAQGRLDGGFTTGCAFNPRLVPPVTQNLYTTLWAENKISVVADAINHTVLSTIDTTTATAVTGGISPTGHPETIAFDTDGNFFVGLVDGTGPNLLKYDKAHTLIGSWTLPIAAGMRGVDSIDLDNDQVTIFWTSEDPTIRSFNTQTSTAGANFATFPGRRLYNVRLLQPGDVFGVGAVMAVADTTEIKILNASGAVVNTYGESLAASSGFGNGFFSVSIDASGNQLLSGDFYGGRVVKFNANDTVAQTYSTGKGPFFVNGVCARGEITRAVVPIPDVGFFVVGDIEAGFPFTNPPAGNTVIFHEQNWNSLHEGGQGNPPSPALISGPVPNNSSFKGFAENATLSLDPCGQTFTSKGGSAGPGALQVGQQVAILVTDEVVDPPGGAIQGQGVVIAIILVTVTQFSGGGVPVGKGTVTKVLCTT